MSKTASSMSSTWLASRRIRRDRLRSVESQLLSVVLSPTGLSGVAGRAIGEAVRCRFDVLRRQERCEGGDPADLGAIFEGMASYLRIGVE